MKTEQERIQELESDKEILLKAIETIFQTGDYKELCDMQIAMEGLMRLCPEEPEPRKIVTVLKLVKGFFRES